MKRKRYSVEQIVAAVKEHEHGTPGDRDHAHWALPSRRSIGERRSTQLRPKRPCRHVSATHRQPSWTRPTAPHQAWSMDFVSDQLQVGHRFRALTLVDVFTRECLDRTGPSAGLRGCHEGSGGVAVERGTPRHVFCDNGSEFAGRLFDLCAYRHKVKNEH